MEEEFCFKRSYATVVSGKSIPVFLLTYFQVGFKCTPSGVILPGPFGQGEWAQANVRLICEQEGALVL